MLSAKLAGPTCGFPGGGYYVITRDPHSPGPVEIPSRPDKYSGAPRGLLRELNNLSPIHVLVAAILMRL